MQDVKELYETVTRQAPPRPNGFERMLRRRDRKRRNQRITAGVVGIAVFVAAVWIVTSVGSFDRTQTPAVSGPTETGPAETGPAETGPTALEPAVPLPGIPPDGATPSLPETGELVLSVVASVDAPAREELTQMYVYADGRLIWLRDGAPPESTDAYNTGLVEQRLTPEGVELMRSEVISSGLIGRGLDPHPDSGVLVDGEADPDTFPFVGIITVPNADRVLGREFASPGYWVQNCPPGCPHIATAEEERRLQSLYARLTDPASWLPASAWVDEEIRAYVPSTYRVCYGGTNETIERDPLLYAIPGPVQELLEAKDAENERFVEPPFGVQVTGYCSELTTEEARDVVRGLDDGGFEREQLPTWNENSAVGDPHAHATFEYFFSVPDLVAKTATLTIDPYVPHGAAICIPCG